MILSAVWQALIAFFGHLKTAKHGEKVAEQTAQKITEATQKAAAESQTKEAERHRADEQVRGASEPGAKLDKWMRD